MRRLVDLPEETWKELKGEALKRNLTLKGLFTQMADDVLHPKLSALEMTHFGSHPAATGDVWSVTIPEVVPGKMPSDHTVIPGGVPRSVTTPQFGRSRPAPKSGKKK